MPKQAHAAFVEALANFCHLRYFSVMSTMNISLPDSLKSFVDQQVFGVALARRRGRIGSNGRAVMPTVSLLCFDVFGTVVDWRSSVVRQAAPFLHEFRVAVAPFEFADAWRSLYDPSMEAVRSGRSQKANHARCRAPFA
ncbi:hypothetical protein JJB09_19555 [Rhizobium sp. KVB221]|uniref:Haloacid dehalogenase type II n=1 Tax=Rhizobium setariae TaxID=2801340 RepID=A0A937CME4_9HYPH|nr:hypothetical protein [Rhizobium setariae]MBL0374225.1 hypothetical protein [Rhizobium setariae]